ESANYIGARSVTAAIKPDIKLQPTRHVKTMDALQTGCVHIKTMDALQTGCVHINTVNKALRVMGYDTTQDVCGHGFRAMACSALIESGLWSRDAVERQMSHQERNGVRAAYIHKAEHLEERRLMLQWWADFLDANRDKGISPFEYAKINNPLK
ncbi:TPA: tyrosine-type recombinase/integrase, partial [Shigella sonnei]